MLQDPAQARARAVPPRGMLLRVSSAAHPGSPQVARGEQPSEASLNPAQLLLILCSRLITFCISHLFSRQNIKPCAGCRQLFVQGRMGVSALSEIFNISKANNADLFHALSPAGFSKAAEQHRSRAVLQGRRICSDTIAKKKKIKKILNTFFCSSELNEHVFNHMLLLLAFNNAAALISFLFIFCSCLFQK